MLRVASPFITTGPRRAGQALCSLFLRSFLPLERSGWSLPLVDFSLSLPSQLPLHRWQLSLPYPFRRLFSGSHICPLLLAPHGLMPFAAPFLLSFHLSGFPLRELGLEGTGKPMGEGGCATQVLASWPLARGNRCSFHLPISQGLGMLQSSSGSPVP